MCVSPWEWPFDTVDAAERLQENHPMEPLIDSPPPEVTLRVVRVLAPLAALAMAGVIVVGLLTAPEGAVAELLGNAWGRVTIIDLYLSFLAIWVWIVWRERTPGAAVVWGVLLVFTGSIALWGYIGWRASSARDMGELLLGPHDIGG